MWLFVLVFCFLSLMIYVSLALLRLLPQIIAGAVFFFVAVFVVARVIDAIGFVVSAVTYFFNNFWTIFGVTLGAVAVASLVWMIVPPVIRQATRNMRRFYNRRTMYLLDHEG